MPDALENYIRFTPTVKSEYITIVAKTVGVSERYVYDAIQPNKVGHTEKASKAIMVRELWAHLVPNEQGYISIDKCTAFKATRDRITQEKQNAATLKQGTLGLVPLAKEEEFN